MSGYIRDDQLDMTFGESFNSSTSTSNSLLPPRTSLVPPDSHPNTIRPFLPPAVATVPPDHVRGYLHSKRVNQYLVGNALGEGSFAKVKEAFHIQVGEKVAMKIIDKKRAQQDPYVAKNFRREAKLLQMVRHPNILHLLEVIETDTSFYLITELCSGGELMKHIYKKGHLDETETRKYMRHIVSAVDHLHKAGIIHRDLKVENLLLDSNMEIKLIDFGLSNEEYIHGDNGIVHCNTQCGSPAYAAPELLGHKSYSPQVDIWSIGVNMYAMLTGCLPYTVEPFNITALHAKMLENKMNPIPDNLSSSCKNLLQSLLRSNPDERIMMGDIMRHPWMNEGHALQFGPSSYPNKLQLADLNNSILLHMIHVLKIRDSEDELIQELLSNRATHANCVYHLLAARFARYNKQFNKTRVRRSKISRDQGYYEGDDDDLRSVASMPTRPARHLKRPAHDTRRPSRKEQNQSTNGQPTNDRPVSLHEMEKETEEEENEDVQQDDDDEPKPYNRHRRRSTMPELMLKEDLEKLREKMKGKEEQSRKKDTKKHDYTPRQRTNSDDAHSYDRPSGGQLTPLHQPPGGNATKDSSSTFKELRHEISTHLGHHNNPTPQIAWASNPTSRNTSRQASRYGTRQPPGMKKINSMGVLPTQDNTQEHTSRGMNKNSSTGVLHTRATSYDQTQDDQEMVFHEVKFYTLPRKKRSQQAQALGSPTESSTSTSSHLPSIVPPSYIPPTTKGGGRDKQTGPSPWSRTRHTSENYEPSPQRHHFEPYRSHHHNEGVARTEAFPHSQTVTEHRLETSLDVDAVVKEIQRTAAVLKIREVEKKGPRNILFTWTGIKFQLSVAKENGACRFNFKWISGGEWSSFNEKQKKLIKKLKL